MNEKSMLQLLAPVAVTIAWYLAELIGGGILLSIYHYIFFDDLSILEYIRYDMYYSSPYGDIWKTLAMLPFDFKNNFGGAVFFYIVDLILIIIAEVKILIMFEEIK